MGGLNLNRQEQGLTSLFFEKYLFNLTWNNNMNLINTI